MQSVIVDQMQSIYRFFFLALAETVAQNTSPDSADHRAGWGNDDSRSSSITWPWSVRGGRADLGTAGLFAFARTMGNTDYGVGWQGL